MNRIVIHPKETTGKMIPRKPTYYFYTGDSLKYFKTKRECIFKAFAISDEYTFLSMEVLLICNELTVFKNEMRPFAGNDQFLKENQIFELSKSLDLAYDYYQKSVKTQGNIVAPAKWLKAAFEKLDDCALYLMKIHEEKRLVIPKYKCKSIHFRCLSGIFHLDFLKDDSLEYAATNVDKNEDVEN